ncbi:pyroglutamylated RFamide peptide receptor-like [Orbicella faveolata]|uniref:pyroglutamylated RFamide peptide receptor-like n=1 Tax=Orbicella faveolata TaxID=48498 RepID=UPI0009E2B4BE|nr:pyroglutamylated RFamide peptide receptor-like [Orbicella faveolata]
MPKYTESVPAQIGITTANSILAVLNIVGNCLVCLVVIKHQDMRTSVNYLLMNLAVADMLVGLFFTPQYIFMHMFTHPGGVTGTVLCRLLTGSNVAWVGGATSVFTLVVIAIERYSAVMDPFGNRGRLTTRRLKVIIPCSWLFGLVINFPGFLVKNFDAKAAFCIRRYPEEWMAKTYTLIWFLLLAFFPVVIMAALYSRVVHTLWFHRPQHHAFDSRQQGVLKVRRRVTLMVVTVSAIFALCWMSGAVTYLVAFFSPVYGAGDVAYVTESTVVMFNSAVNPIVYALINQQFSKKIKYMMCCRCRPGIHSVRKERNLDDLNPSVVPVPEREETQL